MSEENRPNLLYIHSDQHSPYVTGCYGDPSSKRRISTRWQRAV